MKSVLLVSGVLVLVSACSTGPLVESPATLKTLKTVEQQKNALAEQSEQINSLVESQASLSEHLSDIQTGMQELKVQLQKQQQEMAQQAKRDDKAPVVREIVERPRKPSLQHSGKAVVGRVEYVWINGAGEYLKARVDTGEKTSVLYAQNIQQFERNGDDWVRFEVKSEADALIALEAPLQRQAKVRVVGKEETKKRPVVKLRLILGELDETTDFALSDQKDMLYPVLLGRSFLQDIAIVDVGRKFTRKRDPKLTAKSDP